jgi:protease PrsW
MQGRRSSTAFTIVVTVVMLVCAAAMGLLLLLSGAPGALVTGLLLALVPVGPLIAVYMWLDRYEPEPRSLLLLGLGWGAFVATSGALVLQLFDTLIFEPTDVSMATIVAPITEEAVKGLFILLLLFYRRNELDGVLDGLVYAGMVGIGFAFTENILYLGASYNGTDGMGPGGLVGMTSTFVVRCLFSPFAHPLFTAFAGIGVGIAVSTRKPGVRWLAPVAGYCCAVLAHATWNASTIFGFEGFAGAYVLIMVPAFAGLTWLGVWSRRSERRMLTSALGDAAQRGLFPATDIGWVVDLRARREARAYAKQTAGKPGEDAMRDYQQAAIELGFLHHRYLRGTAPKDYAVRGQDFLARINAIRPSIAFPGQVVPTR